jgi:hypothetical protein
MLKTILLLSQAYNTPCLQRSSSSCDSVLIITNESQSLALRA